MKRTALVGLVVFVALALLPLLLDDVFYRIHPASIAWRF